MFCAVFHRRSLVHDLCVLTCMHMLCSAVIYKICILSCLFSIDYLSFCKSADRIIHISVNMAREIALFEVHIKLIIAYQA